MPVIVTDAAINEIASIIKQQELDAETIRLRVGVRGGGCSGFSYILDLTETKKDSDEEWTYKATVNGTDGTDPHELAVKVICDPKSYLYLNGTRIDFREELMGRGFVFDNPNATSTCGCGSSFSA